MRNFPVWLNIRQDQAFEKFIFFFLFKLLVIKMKSYADVHSYQ